MRDISEKYDSPKFANFEDEAMKKGKSVMIDQMKARGGKTDNNFYREYVVNNPGNKLIHDPSELDRESNSSRLKQILGMYGLVSVNG